MLQDLFEAILEGGASQQQRRTQSEADPLSAILEGILGGGSGRTQSSGAPDLGGLLEGILGGGQSRSATAPSSGGLGDLLGGILGGGQGRSATAPSSGGLEDILGGILGGSSVGGNSFLGPIISGLAEKLGLPPAIAQMVVSFVLSKLLSGTLQQGAVAQAGGAVKAKPVSAQGYDLDHLLESMSSGQDVDSGFLQSSGMAKELAQQTGLDKDKAERSLQEAFRMLGGQASVQRKEIRQPTPGTLDHLLDTW
jgi:hypothetical protein